MRNSAEEYRREVERNRRYQQNWYQRLHDAIQEATTPPKYEEEERRRQQKLAYQRGYRQRMKANRPDFFPESSPKLTKEEIAERKREYNLRYYEAHREELIERAAKNRRDSLIRNYQMMRIVLNLWQFANGRRMTTKRTVEDLVLEMEELTKDRQRERSEYKPRRNLAGRRGYDPEGFLKKKPVVKKTKGGEESQVESCGDSTTVVTPAPAKDEPSEPSQAPCDAQ